MHPPEAKAEEARPGPHRHRPASALLLDLARTWPAERISIGDLLVALGDRGYGLIMIALALPNLIPIWIPGLSGILGTPIVVLSLMMLAGYSEPVLPRVLRERSFPRASLEAVMLRAEPWLARIERMTQPGTLRLPSRAVEVPAAMLLTLNGILLALPIPFGNYAPAIAITLTSVSLLEADRRLFLVAIPVMLAAIAIDIAIVMAILGMGGMLAGVF
jgi:hypothetical protein